MCYGKILKAGTTYLDQNSQIFGIAVFYRNVKRFFNIFKGILDISPWNLNEYREGNRVKGVSGE